MKKEKLTNYIHPIEDIKTDYSAILDLAKDANFVFIGESTHGSEEFYKIRAEITKQLIIQQNFNAIAIEGDWPDTYNINKYVKGDKTFENSVNSLKGFKRFPAWMWRNKVIVEFIDWLHDYNISLTDRKKVGFYGLDLYSLNTSMEVIIQYLEHNDPEAAKRAKQRYSCFDQFKENLQNYGYATHLGITKSCEKEVIAELKDLNSNVFAHLSKNCLAEDEFFYIEQNARLIKHAEQYYRSMFSDNVSSWNVRDSYMAETLDYLSKHLTKKLAKEAKIIIWAHNSHIGDARATESGWQGQLNIGQLARQNYGNKAILIGLLTYSGTVTAASSWDGRAERKFVRPALTNSYEYFFHNLNILNSLITFKDNEELEQLLPNNLLERAIGVIYSPQTERFSHYFVADLKKQFDAIIYLDKTSAIIPLETTSIWHSGEMFDTYPFGI